MSEDKLTANKSEHLRHDLAILRDFPVLKKVFRKFYAVLPSSAAVKRVFSHGREVFGKKSIPSQRKVISEEAAVERKRTLKNSRKKLIPNIDPFTV